MMRSRRSKLYKLKDAYCHAYNQEHVNDNDQNIILPEGVNDGEYDFDDRDESKYDYDSNENDQPGEDDEIEYSVSGVDDDFDEGDDKEYNNEEDDDDGNDDPDKDKFADEDEIDDAIVKNSGYGIEIQGKISCHGLQGTGEHSKLNIRSESATESDNTEDIGEFMQSWHAESEISDQEFETFEENDESLWNKEFERYLDEKPEFRARLQYQVRCVLIIPAFEAGGCNLSSFEVFYEEKFGKSIKAIGFSTAARLCRSMPHVVQRRSLDDEKKLYLVDSTKNYRIVAGIRSGLRRIVYDIVKSHPNGLVVDEFVQDCSRVLSRPLAMVLTELAYDTPNVDSMVRDMLDIVCAKDNGCGYSSLFLCTGAEDPAFTDGILLGGTWNDRVAQKMKNLYLDKNDPEQYGLPQVTATANEDLEMLTGVKEQIGSEYASGSYLEQTIDKDDVTSNNDQKDNHSNTSVPFSEDELFLQARFNLRVLLAVHTSGIELTKLEEAYEKMFSFKLNLHMLGCNSILALVKSWKDIVLLIGSKPEYAYVVPSKDNVRILRTLRSGFRLTIYSFLLASYPEALDSWRFLCSLQQSLSNDLWDTFVAHGYITDPARKPLNYNSISKREDFHVTHYAEFCLMLHDMADFIRLGCQEDGSLIIKLRDTSFPVIEFPEEPSRICNQTIHNEDENLLADGGISQFEGTSARFGIKNSTRLHNVLLEKENLVPNPTLKHQVRLILGSPKYIRCGLPLHEFCVIFKERTGSTIHLNGFKDVKSLMDAMPDIVSRVSLHEGYLKLSKTHQNQRILAATKAGLRQTLYWALLKNVGGLWMELLEGWYGDFSGKSLGLTLFKYGYRGSRKGLLSPVFTFLEDMVDFMNKSRIGTLDIYSLAANVEDPVPADALLLGLSSVDIQYDPLHDIFGVACLDGAHSKCQSILSDFHDKNPPCTLGEGYEADTEGEKVTERNVNSRSDSMSIIPFTVRLDLENDLSESCLMKNSNSPYGNKIPIANPSKLRFSYDSEEFDCENRSRINYLNLGFEKEDRRTSFLEGQLQPLCVRNLN